MKATRNIEWRPVVGFEGCYEVSNTGQVKVLGAEGRGRFNRDRIRKPGRDSPGYQVVALYPGGGRKPVVKRVHVIVLEAFVGPRPDGAVGRHLDDDRDNNQLGNLAWGSLSDNSNDMIRNGRHNHARKTHCKWGHPLSGENLLKSDRQRSCRACARRRNAEYEARKRAALAAPLAGEAEAALAVYVADSRVATGIEVQA